jgi:anti-anti-sigma factor
VDDTSYWILHEARPVVLQVRGRASFDNCAAARDFFAERLTSKESSFVVDLKECRGMDSTFLGILAGLSNSLSRIGGTLLLTRPSASLLTVIKNLGLDRLLSVAPTLDAINNPENFTNNSKNYPNNSKQETKDSSLSVSTTELKREILSEHEQAKMVLEAHENLINANPNTNKSFLDVVEFLRERIAPREDKCSTPKHK